MTSRRYSDRTGVRMRTAVSMLLLTLVISLIVTVSSVAGAPLMITDTPTIASNLTSPFFTNTTIATLNFTVYDGGHDQLTCDMFIDSVKNFSFSSMNATMESISVIGLSEGHHAWQVNCTDGMNNGSSDVNDVTVDLHSPSIALVSPANNTRDDSKIFSFQVADDLSSSFNCDLRIAGVVVGNGNCGAGACSLKPQPPVDGANVEWNVTCRDAAGNSNISGSRIISIGPIIALTSPPSGATETGIDSVTISIASDVDLSSVKLEWDGVNRSMNGPGKAWTIAVSPLTEGQTHTYKVWGTGLISGLSSVTGSRTLTYRAILALPVSGIPQSPFVVTRVELPIIEWSAVIILIVASLLGIAFGLAKVFMIPALEAWTKEEFINLLFSAFIVVAFLSFAGVIESTSNALAHDILASTSPSGAITYWTYDGATGLWGGEATFTSCPYPCQSYIARGFLGATYQAYGEALRGVAKSYAISQLLESFGVSSTFDLSIFITQLDINIGFPMYSGRAIYNNTLSTIAEEYMKITASLKIQEIALAYLPGLAGIFFVVGILTRILWFTRKFGGLLVALGIGLYTVTPLIYVLCWYTIDRSTALLGISDISAYRPLTPGELGSSFTDSDLDPLFTEYNGAGSVTRLGLLDALGRAYIPIIAIPMLAIFTTIGFVRQFSPMIGGDTEIAGLTRII